MRRIAGVLAFVVWVGAFWAGVAGARTLAVGEGGNYRSLAAAAAAAAAGDTIRLSAGEYFECAVLLAPDLVIEGAGAGTVITDRVCEGKALLVARGANLRVRDLVLARARSVDANGAGIRLEAPGLTVEGVRFLNDQVGVLDGWGRDGVVRVADCAFEGGGIAGGGGFEGERPSWAVRVAGVTLLRVEGSVFKGVRGGQVFSTAGKTELIGNRIETGVEAGGAFAVQAGGGALLMRDNVLVAGPYASARDAAVVATGSGAELRGNRLLNGTGRPLTLLLNWMGVDAVLGGNEVGAGDRVVGDDGSTRHRAGEWARGSVGVARSMAEGVLRALRGVLGR